MYFIPKKDQRLLKASKYFLVIEKGIIFDNGAECKLKSSFSLNFKTKISLNIYLLID